MKTFLATHGAWLSGAFSIIWGITGLFIHQDKSICAMAIILGLGQLGIHLNINS